ncbi:ATP-binding protein [Desulfosporosinus youngiae]|uniref:Putative ATPase (AAA+ superfamily) n=1 Tax=Desulfosporosinus youngiae DSM 17734 TaxID=768710 RepID=H5Y5Q3_9FIRM|nr:ATP-binding protein [Desulfosporosinus youngiae]EHQ90779.1 putative ATPase (AAA+ superfamily) [Desulfosporosinus youngiae DSM 17734]
MSQKTLTTTLLALDSLSIYRGLLNDKVINSLRSLLYCLNKTDTELREIVNSYNDYYFELAKSGTMSLQEYILDKIVFDENPFTFNLQAVQNNGFDPILEKAASNDLKALQLVSKLEPAMIKAALNQLFEEPGCQTLIEGLPDWAIIPQTSGSLAHIQQIKEQFCRSIQWAECLKELKIFHRTYGCGVFARYIAFVWEKTNGQGYLKGIDHPDPITLDELVEYQNERSPVIENTLQFLKGFPSNNVLLYGDRGAGKSSTVKAILNEYHTQGLRMVEVPKAYLADFPLIIRQLKNRAQKFIIFVDDLAFGDNEENYTSLKAVLEGGLESKTPNILIYATSNRRHLVKEYFSERAGLHSGNHNEEVHAGDSMQEKLSLADRFGINVVFSSPDQKRYLKIVEGIADSRNLIIDRERLQREALQWALWYNGRSARTAKQFVDWIEGHLNLNI